jgi:hypothetical protein
MFFDNSLGFKESRWRTVNKGCCFGLITEIHKTWFTRWVYADAETCSALDNDFPINALMTSDKSI